MKNWTGWMLAGTAAALLATAGLACDQHAEAGTAKAAKDDKAGKPVAAQAAAPVAAKAEAPDALKGCDMPSCCARSKSGEAKAPVAAKAEAPAAAKPATAPVPVPAAAAQEPDPTLAPGTRR